ncbi:uncharacterized protein BDW47DRAFT_132392 [Aspergillus candidus]|uniref:Uncharacterized protein n=1 Tax=Aspergillus candidus TaxID=41067 RepID=A0A2I2F8Q7_ASPCN|nr:hypothetical protein BDW47DRAFT_132392 [Aspergillus candidus]PLB36995.1 hypothetical protein BDW47DRAFT_132392 [Aspergillus candidus]
MLASPPKRRKTGEPANVDASQTNIPSLRQSAARRSNDRNSFQSPTRASLARSHPEILGRAISRTSTRSPQRATGGDGQNGPEDGSEAKTFGLRDRKALRPSLTSKPSPIKVFNSSQSPSRRASGLQAFAVPPRRVSRRIVPADLAFHSPVATQKAPMDDALSNTPDHQLASELDGATPAATLDGAADEPLQDMLDEPDLPPTPTQLGLERPPSRPSGIMSSSPSAQRGKTGRRRATETYEHSPSKLRSVDYGVDKADLTSLDTMLAQTPVPEPVMKKRKIKNEIVAEIQQLKADITELESWSSLGGPQDDKDRDVHKLLSLLASENSTQTSTKAKPDKAPISSLLSTLLPFATKTTPKTPNTPDPTNPFALSASAQTAPYLTTFAPLNLAGQSSTASNSKPDTFTERHDLTLSAPAPFPSTLYRVLISYETNPETQSLVSVSAPATTNGQPSRVPEYLQSWITKRLAHALLQLDVSGLCWGINRYWEASISRAGLWAKLEDQRAALAAGRFTPNSAISQDDDKSNANMRQILPHLERTSMLFESKSKPHQVLLSCELTLDDWTGEPLLKPAISISSTAVGGNGESERRVELESKRLFHTMLSDRRLGQSEMLGEDDGAVILEASYCVLGVLFGSLEGRIPGGKAQKGS